jgi:hypothetical protein
VFAAAVRIHYGPEKTWENKQGDGKVCEQSRGIRVEVRIGCIREACRPLPASSLVSGLQN